MSDLTDAPIRHPCGCLCTCDVTWDEQLRADDLAWASAIRTASESEDDQITVFVDDTADSMRDALTRRGQTLYPDEDYITADMMNHVMKTEDDVADAYERGRAIESARAESRQALGLPLERGADGWTEAAEQPGWSKDGKYKAFTIEKRRV